MNNEKTPPCEETQIELDITREKRLALFEHLTSMFNKSVENEEELFQNDSSTKEFIYALMELVVYQDLAIQNLHSSLTQVVSAIVNGQMKAFGLETHLRTMLKHMLDKGLATEEELKKVHDEKVLPTMMTPELSEMVQKILHQQEEINVGDNNLKTCSSDEDSTEDEQDETD